MNAVSLIKLTRVHTDGGAITGPWPRSIGGMVTDLRRSGGWTILATGQGWVTAVADGGERVEIETVPDAMGEARETGLSRGWDHANYCEAYGVADGDDDHTAASRMASERWAPGTREHAVAVDGFHDGARRYRNGQWQDGTPQV